MASSKNPTPKVSMFHPSLLSYSQTFIHSLNIVPTVKMRLFYSRAWNAGISQTILTIEHYTTFTQLLNWLLFWSGSFSNPFLYRFRGAEQYSNKVRDRQDFKLVEGSQSQVIGQLKEIKQGRFRVWSPLLPWPHKGSDNISKQHCVLWWHRKKEANIVLVADFAKRRLAARIHSPVLDIFQWH